ncbi:hypothetical protein NEOKW01_2017 [Nematocida sp. AWRm80]|nr:hypothetical protein NEOKW01_2017 [Nematocida sp. AWRm80]
MNLKSSTSHFYLIIAIATLFCAYIAASNVPICSPEDYNSDSEDSLSDSTLRKVSQQQMPDEEIKPISEEKKESSEPAIDAKEQTADEPCSSTSKKNQNPKESILRKSVLSKKTKSVSTDSDASTPGSESDSKKSGSIKSRLNSLISLNSTRRRKKATSLSTSSTDQSSKSISSNTSHSFEEPRPHINDSDTSSFEEGRSIIYQTTDIPGVIFPY